MHLYSPYLNWIDTQEHILKQRIYQWAHINTFSGHLEGIHTLLSILELEFKSLGGEIRLLPLPPLQKLMPDGSIQHQSLGHVLNIRKRPHALHQVLLGGHLDTVYAPSSPFQTIEKHEPTLWKGPGVADMKGGLAILLTALEAVERSPFASKLGWEVIINPDEELGSPSSASIFENAASKHSVGILFEPSFPDGSFVNERKGSVTYTVVVHGKEAHVGRDFDKGHSAVFALSRLICTLENFQNQEEDLIINVADLEGKGPVNIISPLASCRINIRSSQTQLLQKSCNLLEKWAQQNTVAGSVEVKIMQDSYRLPKLFDTKTQKLFESYAQCAHDLNIPFQVCATGGVCDGNILANAGLPTLDTAGVIGGALHTSQEYLVLSSLVERAKLATLFLFKLATGETFFQKGSKHV